VGLSIHLLGPPRIERDGLELDAPRGHKQWGLLTYLLRTRVPSSRERLASLLFPEADDPLGALRWTLSALRRQLGELAGLAGDPLRLSLPPGTLVDVNVLSRGSWVEAVALPGLGHELLDGVAFRSSPGFEMWLENERRHIDGTTAAVLHQASLALLARGEVTTAADYASQLVRLNPFDENAHVLLVRCLRAAGDSEGAERQAETCVELFRRELGLEPSSALSAANLMPADPPPQRSSGRAAVLAQIETGEAAVSSGGVEAGLQRLRLAVASARRGEDQELLIRSLIALGGALVHGARGTDEEGAAALHEGTTLAEAVGQHELAATGWREIGWVQFLRAEYEHAEKSVARTAQLAIHDEDIAWVELIRGTCRLDIGDYAAAEPMLRSAVERSSKIAAAQPAALAQSTLGRFHLMRGELDEARRIFDRALEYCDARGLTAFRPWPESFRAEIDLFTGDLDTAEKRFEHAFAVGCQVGDPCWESIATRGLGLVAAARGEIPQALELLVEAPKLCRRLPDTYLWIEAYSLDALCAVAVAHGAESTVHWIDELEAITARRGMQELLLRATAYRARLGEPGALDAARSLAAQIDNPALETLLDFSPIPPRARLTPVATRNITSALPHGRI
jgi:DNA-binding SARP family transcriptional activator